MRSIESNISPLVENMFPSFYKDEGPNFMAFVKAYYEWMESSHQFILLTDVTDFNEGDTVSQGTASGEIVAVDGKYILVRNDTEEQFLGDLTTITSSSGSSTTVVSATNTNPIYRSRNIFNYRDIDSTTDEFILHFKEKYLKNIQFDIATNKKLLVKNSFDLYRSKGTARAVDLFFKLVYGEDAEVYYPGDDLFRLSDGEWVKPVYLEITSTIRSVDLVGKEITGTRSGATAFVERYIRRRVNGAVVNIFYLSNVRGTFENNELLYSRYSYANSPRVVGSLSEVEVITGGRNFNVGDIVSFVSSKGGGGLARVVSTIDVTGVVDFEIIDGGFGYTLTANTIISEKVLSLRDIKVANTLDQITINAGGTGYDNTDIIVIQASANGVNATAIPVTDDSGTIIECLVNNHGVVFTTNNPTVLITNSSSGSSNGASANITANTRFPYHYYDLKETVVQPLANITYISANAGANTFQVDDIVYQYNPGPGLSGAGRVLAVDVDPLDANVGEIMITIANGTFVNNKYIYTTSNTTRANGTVYVDKSVQSKVMGIGANATLIISTPLSGQFTIGQEIYQAYGSEANNADMTGPDHANALIANVTILGPTISLSVVNAHGVFVSGNSNYIQARDSNTTANLVMVSSSIGIYDMTGTAPYPDPGTHISTDDPYIYSMDTRTTANVTGVSGGYGADFDIGTLGEIETIFINTDLLASNNTNYSDDTRRQLSVTSAVGFVPGGRAFQEYEIIAFNPSTAVNITSGFITLPSANSHYANGDYIKYKVDTGNTAVTDLVPETPYYVYSANTSGIIIADAQSRVIMNTSTFASFGNNLVNETGHYFCKMAMGVVSANGSGSVTMKGVLKGWTESGGTANTSTWANGNLHLYNSSTNTAITSVSVAATAAVSNQEYMSVPVIAAAYGFPKDPVGDYKDIIYNCLTFDLFNIGIISSLTAINPGIDYTVDPFVLVDQDYIGLFGRRDYIIDISTINNRAFIPGERIVQTVNVMGSILTMSNTSGFVRGEKVYQGTLPIPDATGIISQISNNQYIVVTYQEGTFANTSNVYSYISSTNHSTSLVQVNVTEASAKGIVKSEDDNTRLYVKRITFNNTFEANNTVTGQSSGATATVIAVNEDPTTNPIGLNANISANVVTANGTVTELQIVDSGIGYSNSAIVDFVSLDNLESGSAKLFVRGLGTGSGYFKSSRGFLSDVKYIHDGDYYQEYSYEILSKLPFDRYAEIFKKVMHTAGTRVFGSIVLIEDDSAAVDINDVSIDQNYYFNANSDVSSANDTIEFTSQLFANGDIVYYDFETGNTALTVTGFANSIVVNTGFAQVNAAFSTNTGIDSTKDFIYIANNQFKIDDILAYHKDGSAVVVGLTDGTEYFVVYSNTSGIKLSTIARGSVVNVYSNTTAHSHYLRSSFIPIANNTLGVKDSVLYTQNSGSLSIGLSNNTNYYVSFANSSGIKLSSSIGGANIAVVANSGTPESHVLDINKLSTNRPYYIKNAANSSPYTVSLSLIANGTTINITANNTSGAASAGHFLYKTVNY